MATTEGLYADVGGGKWAQNTQLIGTNVTDYAAVTPSNTVDLPKACIGICVTGTAGAVVVTKPNGQDATIPAAMLPVGQIVPLPATRIKVTGTTATGIWAVY